MPDPMKLDRFLPDPVPAIFPVPEYAADGELRDRYEATKSAFQVPWMGVVTMAFAHYPAFFGTLWDGAKDLCTSEVYVDFCRELREMTEARVADLAPAPIAGRLTEAGYGAREIDNIRAINEVFSHGNFPYVTLATIARVLLEGGALGRDTAVAPFTGRHAPDVEVPLVLMERHHADRATRNIYTDLMAALGLPFVNTDYRAFARWPSYFAMAWADLKPHVAGAPHKAICQDIHDRLVEQVAAFPNPGGLDGAALVAAAEKDASAGEVLEVVRLFQYLLPGLVTNVAFFRHQLAEKP